MTDREDGPPSRGPRRYGPSASGTPRTGDQPLVPPRRPLDDAAAARPGLAPFGRVSRPGDATERRRPDDQGRPYPGGDRRTPTGGSPRYPGTTSVEPPAGPRAWSATERAGAAVPPATQRIPAPRDRRSVDPRHYPPLPGSARQPRPARPAGPGTARTGTPPRTPPSAYRRNEQLSPLPGQRTARDRWRRRLWIGRLIAAVLSVVTLVASGFVSVLTGNTGQQAQGIISGCAGFTCNGTTILLVGSDARVDAEGNPLSAEELAAVATEADGGGTSTDTMMLIHIPAGGGRATAVSIPRDSWIADPPPGPSDSGDELVPYSANKVNSFYGSAKFYTQEKLVAAGGTDSATVERESSNAGRKMLISVLEDLTGAHIDHYAEINLFGFYLLSNAIGGVPVCLTAPVNDPMSGAVFEAGPQLVQGTAALSFVRQRHGLPNGDLDRVKRQQAFLSGAISKVLSVGTLTDPSKLAALVDAANRSVVLSDGFNLLQLAEQMSTISSGNINFETVPTHGPETSTTSDALHIDVAEIRRLFAGIDGDATADGSSTAPSGSADTGSSDPGSATASADGSGTVDRSALTVDVQNATVTSGLAASTSEALSGQGWGAGEVSQFPGTTADEQQATTTIFHTAGDETAATQLRSDLGFGATEVDDTLPGGHLRVVVGRDAPDAAGLRSGGVAFPAATPLFTRAAPGTPINAATPGCVN